MIRDETINELQYIPEPQLSELYGLIHSFRLKLNSENRRTASVGRVFKDYTNGYIPTDRAIQQAWQTATHEKYHRS